MMLRTALAHRNPTVGWGRITRLRGVRWAALTLLASACGAPKTPQAAPGVSDVPELSHGEPTRWASETLSPQRGGGVSGMKGELVQLCDATDLGLNRVAGTLAEHQASAGGMLDTEQVTHELRAAGVPQVWPRAWAIVGKPTLEEAKQGLSRWLESFSDGGERRCGIGSAALADGGEVISVIAVDAMADLEPIPMRARTGQWIRLQATLLESAVEAEVVVLGPRGAPQTVPTTLNGDEIRASFAVDSAGQWKVQVLPTFPSGPRPVLEALVFVDQDPPREFHSRPVPGEEGAQEQADDPQRALFEMVNRARDSEGLLPLIWLEGLEVAAAIHAKAMMEGRLLAHDVGLGNPTMRLDALGLRPLMAGENVAHALTPLRTHRALWDSPSHRSNLLHRDFTHVGIGLAQDEDGSFWVCEIFAQFPER